MLQVKYRVTYKISKEYINLIPQYEVYHSCNSEFDKIESVWSAWLVSYWKSRKIPMPYCSEVHVFTNDIVSKTHKWASIVDWQDRILETLIEENTNKPIYLRFVIIERPDFKKRKMNGKSIFF